VIDDALEIPFDPPDPDQMYRNYLRTCKMLGIEPTPREQALGLIQEWTTTIAAALVPPTQHLRRDRHAGHGQARCRNCLHIAARQDSLWLIWTT
jgi:hypothetical protein